MFVVFVSVVIALSGLKLAIFATKELILNANTVLFLSEGITITSIELIMVFFIPVFIVAIAPVIMSFNGAKKPSIN